MIVYYSGTYMAKEDVCISPDDRGFLFADGVYEVICSWNGRLFHARAHFKRLSNSLEALQITEPDLEGLQEAVTALLPRNDLTRGGGKIYIQITRGVAERGHAFPETPPPPTVYASVVPYVPPWEKWEHGVRAILVPDIRWARCDIKSLSLLPNVLASQRAADAGAYEAIQVRDGLVTEGAHTSVCAVFDGSLITHPLTQHILGGVTRDTALALCKKLGIPHGEYPILEEKLLGASEVMLLGTTTGAMPVVAIGDRPIGDGTPGPITRRIQAALQAEMFSD